MYGFAGGIHRHGDGHVFHFEFVDGFHPQVFKGCHTGFADGLGDQVGGAAYLVSKAIRKSRVAAFEDLGMEAIYEFEVEDMPVTVAVDSTGESVHKTGPVIWKQKIAEKSA